MAANDYDLKRVDVEHSYLLTFIEQNVNCYELDQFLSEFEKLCIKHNVVFDHKNVKYVRNGEQLRLF